ncbi:zf-CCHC domain-containing protein [Tanacetum coccineum]
MISKNDEAKMVLYNALPKKEYERIFTCNTAKDVWNLLIITHQGNKQVKDTKIDLFVQKYEEFSISDDETIDYAFARFNNIITSLKALDESFSSRNHVRKFLRALPTKWRPNDSEISKNKKEKYKSLALKSGKVLSKGEASSSDSRDEEYVMAEDKKEKEDRRCFKCGDPNHFISDCPKHSFNDQKAFVVGCWSNSEEDTKKEEVCLMAHDTNEVLSDTPYYSSSSLDNESWQNDITGDKDMLSDFKEFKVVMWLLEMTLKKERKESQERNHQDISIDFEKVIYGCRELKDQSLSVSQICDKKHILDLKNIIPSGGITCLVAKATKDEAVLWHRRLGHVNFKNINKLVKGNLVSMSYLPRHSSLITSCLACRKGKQHRASCKKIEERTVREPLELLHMDLFGPVSVESVNRKKYCLVQSTLLVNVLNKFVTKHQMKTPVRNFEGRLLTSVFKRPFDVLRLFFNTLDHLGKYYGKSEEELICWDTLLTAKVISIKNLLPNFIMMHKGMLLKRIRRVISTEKGKEWSRTVTFTLSTANTPPSKYWNTPTDSDDDIPNDGVFSTNSFDAENTDTEEGGAADYNNMDPTIDVTSTPTLRIHKIHLKSQIISKSADGILTRRKLKESASDQHQALLPPGFEDPAHPNKSLMSCQGTLRPASSPKSMVYVDDIIFGSTKSSMVTGFEDQCKGIQYEFKLVNSLSFWGIKSSKLLLVFSKSIQRKDEEDFKSLQRFLTCMLSKGSLDDQLQRMSISWKKTVLLANAKTTLWQSPSLQSIICRQLQVVVTQDLLFEDAHVVDCFRNKLFWDVLKILATVSARDAQGTAASQGTASLQGTAASQDNEETGLEAVQSTARQSTILQRTLIFEDEAGPSTQSFQLKIYSLKNEFKVDEVLLIISRPEVKHILVLPPYNPTSTSTTSLKLQTLKRKIKAKGSGRKNPKRRNNSSTNQGIGTTNE